MNTRQHVIALNPTRVAVQWLVVALLCTFLSLSNVRAQGFLPGTPVDNLPLPTGGNDPLAGAGNTITTLIDLIDDFNWNNFMNFACNAAGTADDIDQSQTSADARDIVCGIDGFYDQVVGLAEDSEATLDFGEEFFSEDLLSNLAFGIFTPEQVQDWETNLDALLNSENPQEAVAAAQELYNRVGQTQFDNNFSTNVFSPNGIVSTSPILELGRVQSIQESTGNAVQQVQTAANTQGSADIAQAQVESEYPEVLREGIQDQVAPAIQDQAYSAVSTRATIQEVVNSITAYMAQDADQFAYLSSQLTLQAQQQVYTTHTLQITANALLEERSQEARSRQANIDLAATNNINKVTTVGEQLAGTMTSFLALDGENDPLPDLEY
jgi:hypothetical protein